MKQPSSEESHCAMGGSNDILIWSGNVFGQYSVKSTYVMLRAEYSSSILRQSSNNSQSHHLWKQVWKLRVPNKIKVFLWKACKNLLPTKIDYFRHKVISNFDMWYLRGGAGRCDPCPMILSSANGNLAKDLIEGSLLKAFKPFLFLCYCSYNRSLDQPEILVIGSFEIIEIRLVWD